MSSGKPSSDQVSLEDLSIDGRPVTRSRPEDLNTMTLDERDNGLYRDQLHAVRSTYDPFETTLAEVSLAEGLVSRRAGRRRLGAWIFLVIPSAVLGCFGTMAAWDDAISQTSSYLMAALTAMLWWLPAVYWLYVLYRRRPAR